MPNETRVNLKHLLEDLRDAYASPIEEVIVTELIANALDSGATRIRLEARPDERVFRCIDNGEGMNRVALRSYHNIAASTKERGEGIGFAGVGAKLSLLVAEKVVTESRGKHGAQAAAEWFLKTPFRAPWKFVPFSGIVPQGKGTAVTIWLKDQAHPLLDTVFLWRTVQRHYYPLVTSQDAIANVLKCVYKKGVGIEINGKAVRVDEAYGNVRPFSVHVGKSRKAIGAGFIQMASMDDNFWSRLFGREALRPHESGLRISTYGKVIRGGWEWLGLPVKHPELVSGVVEAPALSEILTTNKADFLTTPAALKKYYDVRKAIQRAVLPVLQELGEVEDRQTQHKPPAQLKPLTDAIEGALSLMSESFPELEALVGEHWRRRRASLSQRAKDQKRDQIVAIAKESVQDGPSSESEALQDKQERHPLQDDPQGAQTKRVRDPGLNIVFEDFSDSERCVLGKLVGEKVCVNTNHPAWARARTFGQEPYHVLLTVALTLGEQVQPPDGLEVFVSRFLEAWSQALERSGKLL